MIRTAPPHAVRRSFAVMAAMLLALAFVGLTPLAASAASCDLDGTTLRIHLAASEDLRLTSDGTNITAVYPGGSCTYTDAQVDQIVVTGAAGDNAVTILLPFDEDVSLALGAGTDALIVYGTASADTFTLTAASNGTLNVTGGLTVTGTDTAERLRIYALGGEDTIDATAATCDSWLYLAGGADADTIMGSACADLIRGGGAADTIYGYGGDDHLFGDAGADTIYGGAGNDALYGGTGRDRLFGGSGSDTLYGDGGIDRLVGGYGNDALYGGAGRDRCFGGPGTDKLTSC